MSLPWNQRKNRLSTLLKVQGGEDAEGVALDRLLHGQSVIGKTSKTSEVDSLRFQDRDLAVAGTLEYGQFGVIDVVTCRLNGKVYVRKTIEKRFALRTRDQCSPQFERDILLQAAKLDSPWAPHLLCAYQTPTHLSIVMDYAEGGNLWDVLESSPHEGRILESDLRWWTPQIVSAIHWCHSQGFVHRDIKPHNFVINQHSHVLLIDFGTAAPLLAPDSDGVQLLPKKHCLVPCGTCDYISPEILQAHEEALVQLEMEDDDDFQAQKNASDELGYGRETDWWSLGAMLYEMAYGVAPFFAKDIRQTYLRILDHERSLRFDHAIPITPQYQHFIRSLLTVPERRLGRHNIDEITNHNLFEVVNWDTLPTESPPPDLHLPQFSYAQPQDLGASPGPLPPAEEESAYSQGFAFSALFQSSVGSGSPGLSLRRSTSSVPEQPKEDDLTSAFIGFSWGPTIDAFPQAPPTEPAAPDPSVFSTPKPMRIPSSYMTPNPGMITPRWPSSRPMPASDPGAGQDGHNHDKFKTPMRPTSLVGTPFHTLQRPGTVGRSAARRGVSDREAMKQLVHCIGMSARKKVLESGKKPKLLDSLGYSTKSNGGFRRELRFDRSHPPPKFGVLPDEDEESNHTISFAGLAPGQRPKPFPSDFTKSGQLGQIPTLVIDTEHVGQLSSGAEDTESEGPPSPSPTPRPGSAMSMYSRRSATPTFTSLKMFAQSGGSSRNRSGSLSQSQSMIQVEGNSNATGMMTRSEVNLTRNEVEAAEPSGAGMLDSDSDEETQQAAEEEPEEEKEEEEEEEEEEIDRDLEREEGEPAYSWEPIRNSSTPTVDQLEGRLIMMLGDLRKAEGTLEQVKRILRR